MNIYSIQGQCFSSMNYPKVRMKAIVLYRETQSVQVILCNGEYHETIYEAHPKFNKNNQVAA